MTTDPRPIPASVYAKLNERKRQLTSAYNLLVLLLAVIFVGALLDLAQGMNPIGPAIVIIGVFAGLAITLKNLVTINKEN